MCRAARHATNDVLSDAQLRWGSTGVDYNFGELLPGSIQGLVFADLDRDCVFDPTEYPIAGVKIELLNERGTVVATTFTNSAGHYQFEQLAPGTYAVRETQPAGYFQGSQRAGSHGGDASVADLISQIPIGSGERLTDYDFCEVVPGSLQGMVFADLDRDCVFDPIRVSPSRVSRSNCSTSSARSWRPPTRTVRAIINSSCSYPARTPCAKRSQPATSKAARSRDRKGGDISVPDLISQIPIGSGEHLTDYDFCEVVPGSLARASCTPIPTKATRLMRAKCCWPA